MAEELQKIALVSHSLGEGGAERFAATLSKMLDQMGFEVHIVIIEDRVDYDYCGILYNLGALCKNMSGIGKKLKKGQLLKKYINQNNIDIIIDNRARNLFLREYFAMKIYGDRKTICMVHSYHLQNYLPTSKLLANLLYRNKKLICVSKAIEEEVKSTFPDLHSQTIYNPIDFPDFTNIERSAERYMLFLGRLDDKVKNLMLLLTAYKHSDVYRSGLQLHIMGDGPDREMLAKKIEEMDLDSHVRLLPFQKDPLIHIVGARFTVLTSRYEGFPMSIIESLAAGTPVVSVDCKSGPSEIIINGKNGLLVQNHDEQALADAFRQFAEEGELYHICKSNSRQSVSHLSVEKISKQWMQLLKS